MGMHKLDLLMLISGLEWIHISKSPD